MQGVATSANAQSEIIVIRENIYAFPFIGRKGVILSGKVFLHKEGKFSQPWKHVGKSFLAQKLREET